MDQRIALQEMRALLGSFVRGEIEVAQLVPTFGNLFAPFDPPDLTTSGLTDSERSELKLYIRLKGGWFNEESALIPRNPSWQYGRDTEPYSWLDVPAYRRWIIVATKEAGIDL